MKEVKLQKYPAYKPSGVEWLGETPEHWEVLANKHIFSLKKDLVGNKSADYVLLSLTLNGVIKRDMENPQGKFPAEFNTYQEVKKGDFIFCLFDVEETPRTVGLSDFDGMITGAYTVMRPNDLFDKGFLYYFYLNLDADKRMKPLYTGLRNTITKDNFFSFKTFVPPLAEQTAIANFLDNKTALIDKAIALKEKQIELLKERRQILIHRAVTRGLNPDVKLKDSGVEWIGEIPESWEVKKIKNLGKIINGFAFNSNNFKSDGVRVMKIANIQTMRVDWSDESFVDEKYFELYPQFQIKKNDLVFALTRPIISTGIKATIVDSDEKILLNQRNAVLKPSKDLNKKWIYYIILNPQFVQAFDNQIDKTGQQPNISTYNIGNLEIPFPRLDEQILISAFLENISTKISTAISLKEKEIEKLKEYKSVLINEAVSGKIKVGERNKVSI